MRTIIICMVCLIMNFSFANENAKNNNENSLKMPEDKYKEIESAIVNGDMKALQQFVKSSGNFNQYPEVEYWPPLLIKAVMEKKYDAIKYMLENGADIEIRNRYSSYYTPLHHAVKLGDSKMVMFLLNSGANIHAKSLDGFTSLFYAKMGQHDEIEKLLKEKGLTETQGPPPELDIPAPRRILNAFDKKDYAKLEELLNNGIDPNLRLSNGTPVLERAAWIGDAKAMEILIKHGAKVRRGALFSAVRPLHEDKDYLDVVKLLVENGADINHLYQGNTPLDAAMEDSKRNVIRYLKQNGARSATTEERNQYISTGKGGKHRLQRCVPP